MQGDAVFTAMDHLQHRQQDQTMPTMVRQSRRINQTQQNKEEVEEILKSTGRVFEYRPPSDPFWSYPAVPNGTMIIPLGTPTATVKKALNTWLGTEEGQDVPGAWCLITEKELKTIIEKQGPALLQM